MEKPVLIAFATKHGSTEEVAAEIAATLVEEGLDVEVQLAREVQTLDRYGAVVLGAPVYIGRWHRDARRFVKHHHAALASLPIAVFVLGPIHRDEAEFAQAAARAHAALAETRDVEPLDFAVFGGAVDPHDLSFPFNRMPAADIRDWDAIRSWAKQLGGKLPREPVAV